MVKNSPANAGDARDAGWILKSGRSSGEGNGNPLQYSCQEYSHGTKEPGRLQSMLGVSQDQIDAIPRITEEEFYNLDNGGGGGIA